MARTNIPLKSVRIPTKLSRATAIKAKFDDFDSAVDRVENIGTVPSARLNIATVPTTTNTVVIGGHTFTFITTLVAAGATTQVKIGTLAQCRTRLIDAINGTTSVDVVPATTPSAVLVVADLIDTSRVRIRKALTKGGTATTASKATSIAVSETLADAADVWDRANLNESGKAAPAQIAISSIAITAAHITAGKVYVEFPFTPTEYSYTVRGATGGLLPCTDLVTIEANSIKIVLAGGAAPNLVATNVVVVTASA